MKLYSDDQKALREFKKEKWNAELAEQQANRKIKFIQRQVDSGSSAMAAKEAWDAIGG